MSRCLLRALIYLYLGYIERFAEIVKIEFILFHNITTQPIVNKFGDELIFTAEKSTFGTLVFYLLYEDLNWIVI